MLWDQLGQLNINDHKHLLAKPGTHMITTTDLNNPWGSKVKPLNKKHSIDSHITHAHHLRKASTWARLPHNHSKCIVTGILHATHPQDPTSTTRLENQLKNKIHIGAAFGQYIPPTQTMQNPEGHHHTRPRLETTG